MTKRIQRQEEVCPREADSDRYDKNAVNTIEQAFNQVKGVREDLIKKILTIMDMHAVLDKFVDEDGNEISLKEWIEKEATALRTPDDFNHFTRMMQMAVVSFREGRAKFLPDKKIDKQWMKPEATSVIRRIESGFKDMKDVELLFNFAQLDVHKSMDDFMVDRKKGKAGHERYTACRLMKRALAMSAVEKYMTEVGQWARYIFGVDLCPDSRSAGDYAEMGLFAGSTIPRELFAGEEARREEGDFSQWKMIDQLIKSPKFVLQGLDEEWKEKYGVKFIEFSFKDANEAIRKMERKGKMTPEEINELFRFRVVLEIREEETEDDLLHRKLEFLSQVDTAAKLRSNLPIKVETRSLNGFPQFSYNEDEDLEQKQELVDLYEFEDFELGRKEGTLSGEGYSRFGQKIKYCDPDTGESLFAFEMQAMDEKEYMYNENPKTTAAQFPRKIESLGMELPRMESVMSEDQYLVHLEAWLRNYHERHPEEKSPAWELLGVEWGESFKKGGLPKGLEGVHTFRQGWKSKLNSGGWRGSEKEIGKKQSRFKFDFAPGDGKIDDQKFKELAQTAFDFLWASGQIQKVPQIFPQSLVASQSALEKSSLFLGADVYKRIAKKIPRAHKKMN